ncbi:hypothetical protein H9P43_003776 [Blastocladiella emersonii ATCC 22665]|nr:hypothetical protein H9P43_003776 [Blastocladiella emersonii ATCC 22665]
MLAAQYQLEEDKTEIEDDYVIKSSLDLADDHVAAVWAAPALPKRSYPLKKENKNQLRRAAKSRNDKKAALWADIRKQHLLGKSVKAMRSALGGGNKVGRAQSSKLSGFRTGLLASDTFKSTAHLVFRRRQHKQKAVQRSRVVPPTPAPVPAARFLPVTPSPLAASAPMSMYSPPTSTITLTITSAPANGYKSTTGYPSKPKGKQKASAPKADLQKLIANGKLRRMNSGAAAPGFGR